MMTVVLKSALIVDECAMPHRIAASQLTSLPGSSVEDLTTPYVHPSAGSDLC